MLSELAAEMVRVYEDHFGRGPTRARAYWCGGDTVTVLLHDTFTPAERGLALMGEHQRLREARIFMKYAIVREFCEPVERLTGRKVRGFVSGIDTQAEGLGVETFVLHPEGADDASRIELAGP
jgi:uncharacterized protein YbcI